VRRRLLTPVLTAAIALAAGLVAMPALEAKPKPALAAVTDGQVNVVDCGANPNGAGNSTAAFQACINLAFTAYPRRGLVVNVPPGVYNVDVGVLTFPTFNIRFVGIGSVGAYGIASGALIKAVGNDGVLFNFDGGNTLVRQSGPSFEHIALDCFGTTGVTAVKVRMTNRASFDHLSVSHCATGVLFSAGQEVPVSGGDSAWHTFHAPRFYRNGVGIDGLSLGLTMTGGDFILAAGQVGIRWPGQWLRIFGTKFDGGEPAIDITGGAVLIDSAGFEKPVLGIRMRRPGPGPAIICGFIEVHKSLFSGGIGNQTAIDVGPGCTNVGLVRNHAYFYGPGVNQYLVDASAGGVTVI
jgi:hypothetical protein